MGTVIDDKQRSNVERHQRWDRIQRADLLAQYHSLQVGFPISTEKFQIPPDLVVKCQAVDIIEVISLLIW
jgi:hypothetical protein